MLGMTLTTPTGHRGPVDAQAVSPDGRALVRINDAWFLADECK